MLVRVVALLVDGVLAGFAAAAVLHGAISGRIDPAAWIALGFLAFMLVVSAVVMGLTLRLHRVRRPAPLPRMSGVLRTLSGAIDAAGAQSLRVEITLTHGRLHLTGGARPALWGSFRYDDADWLPPFVRYAVNGSGQGRVVLSQQAIEHEAPAQGHNDWMIQLNDKLAVDLAVRIGEGQGTLELGGLALSRLDVWPGAGDVTLDLGGEWKQSMAARVHAGLGKVTVSLPKQVGVRVVPQKPGSLTSTDGLVPGEQGGLVNTAYATSPVKLELAIDGGLGQVLLQSVDPDSN
jgi:hypothetical protein